MEIPSHTADVGERQGQLIKCRVNVKTAQGEQHSYFALARSTCLAVVDALDRFGFCAVSVKSLA